MMEDLLQDLLQNLLQDLLYATDPVLGPDKQNWACVWTGVYSEDWNQIK